LEIRHRVTGRVRDTLSGTFVGAVRQRVEHREVLRARLAGALGAVLDHDPCTRSFPASSVSGWVADEGGAVGFGDFEGGVGEEFGVPAGVVDAVVVAAAKQDEVVG
jgi:hypothetical protein